MRRGLAFRTHLVRKGAAAAAAAFLCSAALGAPAAAEAPQPLPYGPDVARWPDFPTVNLERDRTHLLQPGAVLFRAPIRAHDAYFLAEEFQFGPEGARYRLPAGTRFFLGQRRLGGPAPYAFCTFPQRTVPDPALSSLLLSLMPLDPRERPDSRRICFYERRGTWTLDRVEVIRDVRRRATLLPGFSFPIEVPGSMLWPNPNMASETGTLEISYRVGRRGRPALRVTMTDGGEQVYFESLGFSWPGDLAPSMPIDPVRPTTIPISYGQLTFSGFDPLTGTIRATVDREVHFTIDRMRPRRIVFFDPRR
jgi:hypothetical protein